MGILDRVLRRRPEEEDVSRRLAEAVSQVAGVTSHDVAYNHQQYRQGALTGTVEVPDAWTFSQVLVAATRRLQDCLGDDAQRVTVYLAGRLPDGETVVPGDLGLSQPPLARELARWLARRDAEGPDVNP